MSITNPSQLTQIQQQQYNNLVSVYGEEPSLQIVQVLSERGRNSFASFIQKMNAFLKPISKELDDYYTELYNSFELNVAVTTFDIIRKVSSVRLNLEMDLYSTKVKQKSEADFYALFAVQEVPSESQGKGVDLIAEYIPLARTRPSLKKA